MHRIVWGEGAKEKVAKMSREELEVRLFDVRGGQSRISKAQPM